MRFSATIERPTSIDDRVTAFRRSPGPSGVLILRDVAIGFVPPTPRTPTTPTAKDDVSELSLLAVAGLLGEPVGYLPEHGGVLVQNLVPTRHGADRQISTSSRVMLEFHTETAFHPHRPHYLALLCLRGDPAARTTYCSVSAVLPHLSSDVVTVLSEPRFRCGVDESFTGGVRAELRPSAPVLWGDPADLCMTFDADLMVAADATARRALVELGDAVRAHHASVVLDEGDLLVIDNTRSVHGRSPYKPRFDGTDRWLQRAFVVDDLAPSAADRVGRVITTRFT